MECFAAALHGLLQASSWPCLVMFCARVQWTGIGHGRSHLRTMGRQLLVWRDRTHGDEYDAQRTLRMMKMALTKYETTVEI